VIERNDSTLCSAMIGVDKKERDGADENNVEDTSEYEKSGV